MQISLIIKNNKLIEFGYQCKSCIFCQASVSLLSRKVIQFPIEKISKLLLNIELLFEENFNNLKKIIQMSLMSLKKL